jgi:hypothetical protein
MKPLSKWILFSFIISTFLLGSTYTHPTPTAIVEKRQDAQANDIVDLHHATVGSRTMTTATATATTTTAHKGGQNGNSGSDNSNNDPVIIPAYTSSWYGKYKLLIIIIIFFLNKIVYY